MTLAARDAPALISVPPATTGPARRPGEPASAGRLSHNLTALARSADHRWPARDTHLRGPGEPSYRVERRAVQVASLLASDLLPPRGKPIQTGLCSFQT